MRTTVERRDEKTNRKWAIAGIVGIAILGVATGAQAGEGHRKHHRDYYYAPQYVAVPPGHMHYYAPAPVMYAPRPVMMYPAPVAYVPAYPAYGAPQGLNLNFNIPLR